MKSEVVRRENYRDYEILVRELSFDTDETVETISWIPNTWYCGYVVIPANDKFYNASEDLLDTLDVHGGKSLIDQIIELNKEYKVSFNIFMRDKKSKDELEKMIEQALSETIGKDNTVFAFNIEVE